MFSHSSADQPRVTFGRRSSDLEGTGPATPRDFPSHMKAAAWIVAILVMVVAGCGSEVDPTPEKIDGTPSYEFEQDDLDRAEGASDAVKEYCADAVSEAQRLGCESHVTEDEIP